MVCARRALSRLLFLTRAKNFKKLFILIVNVIVKWKKKKHRNAFQIRGFTVFRGYYTVVRRYEVYLRLYWKKYFASECSERVKSFFQEKINFICSNQRVIFFLLRRYECFENKKKIIEKQRNDVSDIFTSEDMENISFVSRM